MLSSAQSANAVSIREYVPADNGRVRQIVRGSLVNWDISGHAYRNTWNFSKMRPLATRLAFLALVMAAVGFKGGLVAIVAYEIMVLCAIRYAFYYHYVE